MDLQHVTLRQVAAGDGAMLATLHSDDDTRRWMEASRDVAWWEAEGIPNWQKGSEADEKFIVLNDAGDRVGLCYTFQQKSVEPDTRELTIAILPEHRRHRYAEAAVIAMIAKVKTSPVVKSLLAVVEDDNEHSRKLSALFDPAPTHETHFSHKHERDVTKWTYRLI